MGPASVFELVPVQKLSKGFPLKTFTSSSSKLFPHRYYDELEGQANSSKRPSNLKLKQFPADGCLAMSKSAILIVSIFITVAFTITIMKDASTINIIKSINLKADAILAKGCLAMSRAGSGEAACSSHSSRPARSQT